MITRKFWDLDHPPVVGLVGDGERVADLEEALEARTVYRVEWLPSCSAALQRLDEDPAVEVLWIAAPLPAASSLDVVETVTERNPATVLVVAPGEGSESLAARATAAGASEYVRGDASLDERVERVEAAVDRAVERRHDARKRSVLDTLLSDLEVSIFAKDERARHVLYADRENAPPPEEIFGKTDLDAFPWSTRDLEVSYRDDLAVIEEGTRIDGKVERYEEMDGRWQWTKKVPWTDRGTTRGLVGLTLEISEWKRRERELLHLVGRLQQIPQYLTHDLRTPLEVARGYLDVAREGDEDAFDTIEDSLDRMNVLLEDFHSFATTTRESVRNERPLSLAAAVEDSWQYLSEPGAALQVDVPEDVTIVADEAQLRTMLQNLLRNAIDHAGPRVSIRVGLLGDGFYVADDGPGLGPTAEADPFREGITTVSDGSGLGLAILREAAHLQGWGVDATESEDGGARFEIRGCLVGRPLDATPTDGTIELLQSTDVGDPDVPGRIADEGGGVTVTGAGKNVWADTNEFHYYHAPIEDDVRIQARLTDMEVASKHSKAGVMVRSSLDTDAAYGFVGRYADRCPEVLWREQAGWRGTSEQVEGVDGDVRWFRLDRVRETVCCYVSTDGTDWELLDRRQIALGETPYVGLAVCSVDPEEAIRARFEDVEVVPLEW